MRVWLGFIWQKIWVQWESLCEHDKENIDSVNGAEFHRSTDRPSPSKNTKSLHVVIFKFCCCAGSMILVQPGGGEVPRWISDATDKWSRPIATPWTFFSVSCALMDYYPSLESLFRIAQANVRPLRTWQLPEIEGVKQDMAYCCASSEVRINNLRN